MSDSNWFSLLLGGVIVMLAFVLKELSAINARLQAILKRMLERD